MRPCTQSEDGVWAELAIEVLRNFGKLRMRAFGSSMVPAVFPGDILTIRRASANDLRKGDIVLCTRGGTFVIHRLIGTAQQNDGPGWITRGDALNPHDPPVAPAEGT